MVLWSVTAWLGCLLPLVPLTVGDWARAQQPLPEDAYRHKHSNVATKQAITPGVIELVQQVMAAAAVPGVSLAVVHSGGVVEHGDWGIKSEDGEPMAANTLFNIASCSKAFLSASVGLLMDDFRHGRNSTPLPERVTTFDWHTKMVDILPGDWMLMDEWASASATIQDVLSHHSGLAMHDLSYGPTTSARDIVRNMRHLRPAFEMRQRMHYTNQMYTAVAYTIATYSGMSYPDFVKERIFKPLGMSTTTFSRAEAANTGLLTHGWSSQGRRLPYWLSDEKIDVLGGPGGIISSSVDMVKWISMLLDNGIEDRTNATIIPPSVLDSVSTAQSIVLGRPPSPSLSIAGYGMGWLRYSQNGHEILTHAGGVPGFTAYVYLLPADGMGIVLLANAAEKHRDLAPVIHRIIDDFFGLSTEEMPEATHPQPEPTASDEPWHAPPLPRAAFVGTYTNPGYPNITICAATTATPECASVLDVFRHFEDTTATDLLYASLPSVWTTHARIAHVAGSTFHMQGTYLFPHGYGRDTSPFETSEEGQSTIRLEFVMTESGGTTEVSGFGIFGFVGEQTEAQRLGGSVQDTAEVWFTKV